MGNSRVRRNTPGVKAPGGGQRPAGRDIPNGGQRVPPVTGKPTGQRNAAGVLDHSGQGERGKQGKGGNSRKKSRRKRRIIILVLILVLLILLCLWLRSCGHDYGPFQDTQTTEESHGQGSTENASEGGGDTELDTEREYETDSSEDTQDTTEGEESEGTDSEKPSEPDGGGGEDGPGKERLNLALSDSYRITDRHRVFYIGYPKDNVYDVRFTFMDENGKELYRTKYVAPGTNVAVDGTAFLQKGEQKLDCLVSVYERQSGAKVSDCTTIVLNIKYE